MQYIYVIYICDIVSGIGICIVIIYMNPVYIRDM